VTPGCRFPVFDLDVGRVGLQICWDIAFPEGWKALADQGTELVLYATDPIGLLGVRAHAWEHEYWIVGSTHRAPAAVVDPTGHVVATTSEGAEAQIVRIDLDYRVLNTNCLWEFPESEQAKYADQVRFEFHQEEYLWLVTSVDPALPVGKFLKDHGLISGAERRAHNLELIDQERPELLET
jgi:predicted amidohydrolase